MEFRKVALLGAGAVGSYLLWGLSKRKDIELCVIAEGERKARMERDGIVINGVTYHPDIRTPGEAAGADLLIIALKFNALRPALDAVAAVADAHTTVISLMNGVESEDILAERLGAERVLPALIKIASMRKGNESVFDPETTIGIICGEYDPARTERTDALTRLMDGTGIRLRITDSIVAEIWAKFRFNVSLNLPQAMVNCGVGAYRDSEHLKFLRNALRKEIEALAAAQGIDLGRAAASSAGGSAVRDRARYSTLQDLDAKRHTEVDTFAGAAVRIGRKLGIPTPYCEFTYHMIKAIEEKNDGKFDYE